MPWLFQRLPVYTATGPPAGRRLSQQLERHHSCRWQKPKDLQGLGGIHSSPGCGPTPSTVYETVFTNEVSLKSQFARCSLNQLQLEPTSWACWRLVSYESQRYGQDSVLSMPRKTGARPHSKCYRRHEHYQYPPVRGLWSCTLSRRVPATGFEPTRGGGVSVYNDEWAFTCRRRRTKLGTSYSVDIRCICISCVFSLILPTVLLPVTNYCHRTTHTSPIFLSLQSSILPRRRRIQRILDHTGFYGAPLFVHVTDQLSQAATMRRTIGIWVVRGRKDVRCPPPHRVHSLWWPLPMLLPQRRRPTKSWYRRGNPTCTCSTIVPAIQRRHVRVSRQAGDHEQEWRHHD
jgi:hypothetical protein